MSGERKALIVANDEYEHEGLRHLSAPAADAEALGRVLSDPQIGGFDVEVVHNQPSHVVYGRIEDMFADSRRDDVLLLHFSCHGLKSESGELFFAARNTRPNRLGSTAVPADFVQRCMKASRSRSIVLLLDCCYGGAFSKGVTVRASGDVDVLDSFPTAGLGGGRGRAVITASNAMEYAFEADTLADDHTQRPSVFTAAVAEGLATGEADRDEDGWVSLNELYDYVFDRVRERNPNQTPSRDVEMQGELYLARSQRRRIRPGPIPPELEAARTAADMYTRLGAMGELRFRLASDNLEAAVGAYEALADTAHTDIEYVAQRARAVLREVAVQPAQTEVHFGRIAQGSPSPHRTVELRGPPIARACAPSVSHDWIRATSTAEGIGISIDTTRAGPLRGSVEVKGPTGEAAVTVDVDLVPQESQTTPRTRREPRDTQLPAPTPTPTLPSEEPEARPTPQPHASNPYSGLRAPGRIAGLLASARDALASQLVADDQAKVANDANQRAGEEATQVAEEPDARDKPAEDAEAPPSRMQRGERRGVLSRYRLVLTLLVIGGVVAFMLWLSAGSGAVQSVAFSPDGSLLASGSDDATVRLWDPETGEQVGDPLTAQHEYIPSVAFSLDGSLLASGGAHGARLWDPETGEQVGDPLTGHDGSAEQGGTRSLSTLPVRVR